VSSQRVALDLLMVEMRAFGRALRPEEQELLDGLLAQAYRHYGAVSSASSFHSWAFLVLSVMLEQEKRLRQLEGRPCG